ncbi:DUF1702 family protein [Micromonospora sp. KC606]|uniref:DUF1702 family protein n=1 Tax=Micromonospora sp. KC606 TaxID=2530379 RepID=UPI0010456932|nr:DUF1702 family protein [Micromonospora sp. KC606]TDC85960.1 DUF1702 family protein [Micromonospora sp. KC606]
MITVVDRLRSRLVARMRLTDRRLDRRISLFAPADDADLITAIGREFAHGFNDSLRTFDAAAVTAELDSLNDAYLAPFYVEGAAMAFAAGRTVYPSKARTAHRVLLTDLPGHKYLIFAGWGWWYAVRPFGALAIRRSPVWRQDSLFAALSIDGMAFATCFLKARPPRFDVPCPFPNPEFEALWLQGYGRALWFVASGHPEVFRDQHERLDPQRRPELSAGLGLATAFAGMRRLRTLPEAPSGSEIERRAFLQGLAFGLTARREASPDSFRRWIDQLDRPSASWVAAATDRCLQPPERAASSPDGGYVAWQRQIRSELPLPERPA